MTAAAECVRCFRSDDDHQAHARGEFDEIQERIWKALGWPCPEFTETVALVFARNQSATSRWAAGRSRQPARPATAGAEPAVARGGAAAAREALNRALNRTERP